MSLRLKFYHSYSGDNSYKSHEIYKDKRICFTLTVPPDCYNKRAQYIQMFKTTLGLACCLWFWQLERHFDLCDSAQIRSRYINATLALSRNWISLQSAGDSENKGMINGLSSTYTSAEIVSHIEKFSEIREFPLFWKQQRLENTGNISILVLIRWLVAQSPSVLACAEIRGQIVVYSPVILRAERPPTDH